MAGFIGGIGGGFGGGSEVSGQNRIHQGPPPPPPPGANQQSNSLNGCQDGFQQSPGSQIENGQQAGQAGPPPPPELKALFDQLKSDKQSGNTQAAQEDQQKIQEFIQNLQQTQGGGQSQGMGQQGGF